MCLAAPANPPGSADAPQHTACQGLMQEEEGFGKRGCWSCNTLPSAHGALSSTPRTLLHAGAPNRLWDAPTEPE